MWLRLAAVGLAYRGLNFRKAGEPAAGRPEVPPPSVTDGCTAMTDIDVDTLGPVDYLVIEFPAGEANLSGEIADELTALVENNTVRVLDLLLLTKHADGSVEAVELREVDDSEIGQLRALEADLAVLLAEENVEEISRSLDPGTRAALLVWENTWAAPFGAAVRQAGGLPVTSGRIPTQALVAAIEADRQSTMEGV
jgi:Family of unknown function (DUF6325)